MTDATRHTELHDLATKVVTLSQHCHCTFHHSTKRSWSLFLQMLYSSFTKFKIPNFACSFCFCCTTFPSHLGTFGQQPPVLHWNYNGEVAPKFDLAIYFDWGVILTKGQRVWAAFCMNFSGIPHSTIFGPPQYARQIPFLAIFGARI